MIKSARRERGSHLYLDPHHVTPITRCQKIDKAAWNESQREHFTYWYMASVAGGRDRFG